MFISDSFILGLFSCRPAAMARFKRDRSTTLIINNQTPHTIVKHPLIALELQVHRSPEQRCRSVQGGRQHCYQDNPSCSLTHQKASIPPSSYSFFMLTLVSKSVLFGRKRFCFQASQTFWQPVEDHTPNKVFTLNISASFYHVSISGRTHINTVPGSIKRVQISLPVVSSKASSLLLMQTSVRDPRSIIASMLRAPSSWKAHLRNGPTMVSTTMNSLLYQSSPPGYSVILNVAFFVVPN